MNFISKIFHGKIDEHVHSQFIRFGKGEYRGRGLLSWRQTADKAKLKGSFEFANDFVLFVARQENITFNGSIWSKEPLSGLDGKKKSGKLVYEVSDITSQKILELQGQVYCFLLNADSIDIKLKIKGKLPKPGKGEDKVDNKFCQLELTGKHSQTAKADFFWDVSDCKKAEAQHIFIITDIVLPKTGEKDFAVLRELAKRKGKVIRVLEIDGKEVKSEKPFEA